MSSASPTAASTRRAPRRRRRRAPRRRFSARVAWKRCGRWGSQEKCRRHAAEARALAGSPSSAMVPPWGSTKRKSAARTVDLPAPDGPVRATLLPGGACSEKARSAAPPRSRYSTRTPSTVTPAPRLVGSASAGVVPGEPPSVPRGAPVSPRVAVPSTSRIRAAAAWPSVLAWNSAPARRSGMKISGATSRTARAVCSPSSPHSRRRPSTMATKPTPKPAMRSMERADRNATRRVRMVATRTPSLAASTSRRPWASRPKARRVGRPSTSWRKWPASEPRRRHWRAERLVASRPK